MKSRNKLLLLSSLGCISTLNTLAMQKTFTLVTLHAQNTVINSDQLNPTGSLITLLEKIEADINNNNTQNITNNFADAQQWVEKGADIPLLRKFILSPDIAEFLIRNGAEVNRRDEVGGGDNYTRYQTVLHTLADWPLNMSQKHCEALRFFLKNGADMNIGGHINLEGDMHREGDVLVTPTPLEHLIQKIKYFWFGYKEETKAKELFSLYKQYIQIFIDESSKRISNETKELLLVELPQLSKTNSRYSYFNLLPHDLCKSFSAMIVSPPPLELKYVKNALKEAEEQYDKEQESTAKNEMQNIIIMLKNYVSKHESENALSSPIGLFIKKQKP